MTFPLGSGHLICWRTPSDCPLKHSARGSFRPTSFRSLPSRTWGQINLPGPQNDHGQLLRLSGQSHLWRRSSHVKDLLISPHPAPTPRPKKGIPLTNMATHTGYPQRGSSSSGDQQTGAMLVGGRVPIFDNPHMAQHWTKVGNQALAQKSGTIFWSPCMKNQHLLVTQLSLSLSF